MSIEQTVRIDTVTTIDMGRLREQMTQATIPNTEAGVDLAVMLYHISGEALVVCGDMEPLRPLTIEAQLAEGVEICESAFPGPECDDIAALHIKVGDRVILIWNKILAQRERLEVIGL